MIAPTAPAPSSARGDSVATATSPPNSCNPPPATVSFALALSSAVATSIASAALSRVFTARAEKVSRASCDRTLSGRVSGSAASPAAGAGRSTLRLISSTRGRGGVIVARTLVVRPSASVTLASEMPSATVSVAPSVVSTMRSPPPGSRVSGPGVKVSPATSSFATWSSRAPTSRPSLSPV